MSAGSYLGEFEVDVEKTEFANSTPADWAMRLVERYGQFEGSHHKAWVLDQAARVLKGTPVVVREARWTDHGPELRFRLGEPSAGYLAWVEEMKGEDLGGGDREYGYDEGIAP